MEHVAIDLGGRESQVCVRAADGEILEEKRWPTRRLRETRVVPATLVRSLGVGSRRTKSDRRDAQILSEACSITTRR
jgi:hypothetical protein